MKISARNILRGTINQLIVGAVNDEVVITLTDGRDVVSVITKESANVSSIAAGKDFYPIIKASNIMIGVD